MASTRTSSDDAKGGVASLVGNIKRVPDDVVANVKALLGLSNDHKALEDIRGSIIHIVDAMQTRGRKHYFTPVDKQVVVIILDNKLLSRHLAEKLVDEVARFDDAMTHIASKDARRVIENMYFLFRYAFVPRQVLEFAQAMDTYLMCYNMDANVLLTKYMQQAQVFMEELGKLEIRKGRPLEWEHVDTFIERKAPTLDQMQLVEIVFSLMRNARASEKVRETAPNASISWEAIAKRFAAWTTVMKEIVNQKHAREVEEKRALKKQAKEKAKADALADKRAAEAKAQQQKQKPKRKQRDDDSFSETDSNDDDAATGRVSQSSQSDSFDDTTASDDDEEDEQEKPYEHRTTRV